MHIIRQLLEGNWRDPDSGENISLPIRRIEIARGIGREVEELLAPLSLEKNLAIVSDANTHRVLGNYLVIQLEKTHKIIQIILESNVKPSATQADDIAKRAAQAGSIIAVGSGTINDLCKYASFLSGKPYMVFGTAPSMNGYASANASIIVRGKKESLPAHPPLAIFLDTEILARAPIRLIRSGLGDSLCRSTAQADWLLSHLVLGTPYRTAPFALLAAEEEALLAGAGSLVNGDIGAIERLARTLILSGIGMYLSGGSYPASQGEHMLAHYMEETSPHPPTRSVGPLPLAGEGALPYHGEQIGVTTLTMAEIQEKFLAMETLPILKNLSRFNDAILKEKKMDAGSIEKTAQILSENWPEIRERIKNITLPRSVLRKALEDAGAPLVPHNLGWTEKAYNEAIANAWRSRNRFTFLDAARIIGA